LLLGKWDNIEHLEASLTLEELEGLLSASRDREERLMKFYAAFKGVDLDKETTKEDPVEAAKRRANAKLSGRSQEELDWEDLGIDYEVID